MCISRYSIAAAMLGLAAMTCVSAQEAYPSKPVRVVVPWTAGQATDAAARAVAERLNDSMKQAFIIENRPGAGGAIGSEMVARSAPDGYTLLAGSTGSVTINPLLFKTNYDTRSFSPVGIIATVPYVLVTAASFPAKNARELVVLLKANPDKYSFASSGNGSIGHLSSELFISQIGAKVSHIPYKGSSGALVDVMAGRVDFMFDSVTSVLPQVRAGKVRAYGVSSLRRSSSLHEVPPLAESAGLPGFDLYAWIGLLAPAGTPEPVLASLNQGIHTAVSSPSIKEKYLALGVEPVEASSPSDMMKVIEVEHNRVQELIRTAHIQAD